MYQRYVIQFLYFGAGFGQIEGRSTFVCYSRPKVCLPKLRELNSYVNVMRRTEDLTEEYIKSFRVDSPFV